MDCCRCFYVKQQCDDLGGNGMLGCLGTFCGCYPCVICSLAPKIGANSGITEDFTNACLKVSCPCTGLCYVHSLDLEYARQKKLKALGVKTSDSGTWLASLGDIYYNIFCPCLVRQDMCVHLGGDGFQGLILGLCCDPCLMCWLGPKIASAEPNNDHKIDESQCMAIVKTCCCTPCYSATIYGEYKFQKFERIRRNGAAAPDSNRMD